jgi:hypothetical protein
MTASMRVNSGWATSAPKAGTANRRISLAEVPDEVVDASSATSATAEA